MSGYKSESPYSREHIEQRYRNGELLEFVFFWGPSENKEPRGCFNQWANSTFVHKHFTFANAEQAMMAEKALVFNDLGTLQQILDCTNPRSVKALGRLVQGFDNEIWNALRFERVREVNTAKFSQNETMKRHLLATGDAILVEASPVDGIWGIKMDERHPDVRNPTKWRGRNLLGQVLMEVRSYLRALEQVQA